LRSRTAGTKDVMRGMVDEGRGVGQRFERLKRVDQAVDGGAARGLPTIEPRQRACASGKRCRFVSETINRCADAGTTPEGCPQHGTAFHGRDSTPWPMLYGETLAPRMKVQPDRDRAAKLKPCVVAMEACCGALEEPRSRAAVAAEACPLPPSLPADHGCNPPNCTPTVLQTALWSAGSPRLRYFRADSGWQRSAASRQVAARAPRGAMRPLRRQVQTICLRVRRAACGIAATGGFDFLKCQTFAASPAEPGELLFWFSIPL